VTAPTRHSGSTTSSTSGCASASWPCCRRPTRPTSATDGNLSRHLQVLDDAGFVRIEKTFEGRRPRTWVSSTKAGRAAFASELAALRSLMASVERRGAAGDPG
jgi:hypothetical protein